MAFPENRRVSEKLSRLLSADTYRKGRIDIRCQCDKAYNFEYMQLNK